MPMIMGNFFQDRKKAALAVAAVGLVICYVGGFLFSDLRGRAKQIDQRIKVGEIQLKKDLAIKKLEKDIAFEYQKYTSYLSGIDKEPRLLVEDLLREIERAAKDSEVSIINLSPQSVEENAKKKSRKSFKADLRLEGKGDRLLDFLHQIQNSKLLIKVVRITLSTKDDKALLLKAEMIVELSVE